MMNSITIHPPRTFLVATLAAFVLATSGCTTVRQEFFGYEPGQIWTAMQAVAESPEYRDWHVAANEVWVNPHEARLEIYRVVERSYPRTGLMQWNDRQEWKFQVVLEETHPPTARFTSRGLGVPARAANEGRRFFADVRKLLNTELAMTPLRPVQARAPQPERLEDDLVEP